MQLFILNFVDSPYKSAVKSRHHRETSWLMGVTESSLGAQTWIKERSLDKWRRQTVSFFLDRILLQFFSQTEDNMHLLFIWDILVTVFRPWSLYRIKTSPVEKCTQPRAGPRRFPAEHPRAGAVCAPRERTGQAGQILRAHDSAIC